MADLTLFGEPVTVVQDITPDYRAETRNILNDLWTKTTKGSPEYRYFESGQVATVRILDGSKEDFLGLDETGKLAAVIREYNNESEMCGEGSIYIKHQEGGGYHVFAGSEAAVFATEREKSVATVIDALEDGTALGIDFEKALKIAKQNASR